LPAGDHLVRHLGMAGGAGRLEDRRLVGLQPEPGQPLQDHLRRRRGVAGAIGVLDAQQELAAMVAAEQGS